MKLLKIVSSTFLAVCFLFLVSGCGNEKVLDCNMEESLFGMGVKEDVKFTFKQNKMNKLNMDIEMTLPDTIKDQWDESIKELDSQYDGMNSKGVKVTTKNDKTKLSYTVNIEADLTKATEEELEKVNLDSILSEEVSKAGIEDAKKDLEDSGFSCKIK